MKLLPAQFGSAVAEAEHGPITEPEIQAKREALHHARESGASDPSAA